MAISTGRRQFLSVLGGATLAWPFAALAQQQGERVRRLGALMSVEDDAEGEARFAALRRALSDLGWVEGHNLSITIRWGTGDEAFLRAGAAELVALQPDVIFAAPVTSVPPLQRETKTIPIVFAQATDPVGLGLVKSLARPGGNITGFATFEQAIAVKWIELLKQIAPSVVRAAVIIDLRARTAAGYLAAMQDGARSLGLDVASYSARDAAETTSAFESFAHEPNVGLILPPSPVAITQRELVVSLAEKYRVPAVYPYRYFCAGGGLAAYGVDILDEYKRAASYVDRILKGEKPADLPVQYATKFDLVINLKTAKALGLTIPQTLLATADEVIE
jgi:putative tryptophan/tyrosine transport system substrate-binding protein